MERLEQALARQAQAEINATQNGRPPVVNTLEDIRRVVLQLAPDAKDHQMQSEAQVAANFLLQERDGVRRTYRASATTKSRSKRQMLLDGIQLLRNRREMACKAAAMVKPLPVNGREVTPPSPLAEEAHLAVDPLIGRWLAAKRDGERIVWTLTDGFTYSYDIFSHQLTRKATEVSGD